MTDALLNLWPAHVTGPSGEWGDTQNRARAFLYERPDGVLRFVVLDASGLILASTDVASYQHNGGGMDVTDPDGNVWYAVQMAGCLTCGGGMSAARAFEMMRGQGEA